MITLDKTMVGPNDVLVSNNMVLQASIAASGDSFDLGFFFDLSCLIETVILHDHLITNEAWLLPDYSSLPLRKLLMTEGILLEHSGETNSDRTKKAVHLLRGLTQLAEDEFSVGKEWYFDDVILSNWVASCQQVTKTEKLSEREIYRQSSLPASFLIKSGISKGSPQYFRELIYNWTLHGHGNSPDPNATYLMRSLLYLAISEELEISFCPDFSRVPIVAHLNNRLRHSLTQEAYSRLAKAFGCTISDLQRANVPFNVLIPPLPALVLSRCTSLNDLGDVLLDTRQEFSKLRTTYRQYEQILRHPKTLGKLLKARKDLISVSERLAKSYPSSENRVINEAVSLLHNVISVGVAPSDPTSYSANLLLKPLEWMREWWIRRRAHHLFGLKKKLDNLSGYENILVKLFNYVPKQEEIFIFNKISAQVERLYFEDEYQEKA